MKITTLRNLFFAVSFITSANLYAGGTNTGCPTITVTFKTTSVSCYGGTNGMAVASATGGILPYTYSWNTGSKKDTDANLAAGTYTVSVTDSNSCVTTATVTITQPAIVVATATTTPGTIGIGGSATLTASVTGGTAPYSYSWTPGGSTSSSYTVSPTVNTTYTLLTTDAHNCPGTLVTATVHVALPLQVVTGANDTICAGSSATLSVNASGGCGNYMYNWQPGNNLKGSVINVSPNITTYYYATVTDSCGTRAIDSVEVVVKPSPVLTITVSGGNLICQGSSVTFTANGALTYSWSPTTGIVSSTGSSITVAPSVNTTYTVVGANSSGCVDSATISISVNKVLPSFIYSGVCSGNTIAFTDESVGGITNWAWNFGDGTPVSTLQNPTHTYAMKGIYSVSETVTSAMGCDSSVTEPVSVNPGQGFDLTGNLQICIDTPGVSTASIQACIYNDRCNVVKGTMKLLLDTAIHITKTISDSIAHVSGDTLIWNYNGLSDTGSMHCVTLTGSVSTLPKGDSVFASLFITPVAGDSVPSNNSYTYWVKPGLQNCVGLPFDPNEKSVLPQGDISAAQQLTYTIHFQNTGTAPAKNVVVIDTLSQYVDPTTLKIISSSSEVITTIASGHIVKFTFNGINLPDTATSKTKSIGVFKYTIYPMRTDTGGEVIKNSAGIYFDANAVVKTNTTTNAIARTVLLVDNINAPTLNIRCFPNPFTSTTSVVFNTDGKHYLEVDDMTGRILETIECTGKQYELQRNNLSAGVYFIKAYNAERSNVAVTKIVLQ